MANNELHNKEIRKIAFESVLMIITIALVVMGYIAMYSHPSTLTFVIVAVYNTIAIVAGMIVGSQLYEAIVNYIEAHNSDKNPEFTNTYNPFN